MNENEDGISKIDTNRNESDSIEHQRSEEEDIHSNVIGKKDPQSVNDTADKNEEKENNIDRLDEDNSKMKDNVHKTDSIELDCNTSSVIYKDDLLSSANVEQKDPILEKMNENNLINEQSINDDAESVFDDYFNAESIDASYLGKYSSSNDIELRKKQYQWISFFADKNGQIEMHISSENSDIHDPISHIALNMKDVDPLDVGFFNINKHEQLFGCEYDPDVLDIITIFSGEPYKSRVVNTMTVNEYLDYYLTRHPSGDKSFNYCIAMRCKEKHIYGFIRFDRLSEVVIKELEEIYASHKSFEHDAKCKSSENHKIVDLSDLSEGSILSNKSQIFQSTNESPTKSVSSLNIFAFTNSLIKGNCETVFYRKNIESNSFHEILDLSTIFHGEVLYVQNPNDIADMKRLLLMFGDNDQSVKSSYVLLIGNKSSLKPYVVKTVLNGKKCSIHVDEMGKSSSLKLKESEADLFLREGESAGSWMLSNKKCETVAIKHIKEIQFHTCLNDSNRFSESSYCDLINLFRDASECCQTQCNLMSNSKKTKIFDETLNFMENHLKSYEPIKESSQDNCMNSHSVNIEMSRKIVESFMKISSDCN